MPWHLDEQMYATPQWEVRQLEISCTAVGVGLAIGDVTIDICRVKQSSMTGLVHHCHSCPISFVSELLSECKHWVLNDAADL